MARFLAFLFLLVVLPTASYAQANAQAKYALVIGNQSYNSSVGALKTPGNDAEAMAAALLRLGFNVALVKDADYASMQRAVARHAEEVRQAGPDAISFVFYAGHGVADPITRTNYLIPVDAATADVASLRTQSVSQGELLARLKSEAPNALHYIVFDACRSELNLTPDPLRSRMADTGLKKGFAPVSADPGMLIAYATAPGESLPDAGSQGTSLFTAALLNEIVKPDVDVVSMFHNVQQNVLQAVGQEPWLSAPYQPLVYLARADGGPRMSVSSTSAAIEAERMRAETEAAVRRAALDRDNLARGRARIVGGPVEPGPCPAIVCTPVSVFFGTDRKKEGTTEVAFGPDRAELLQLGRAIVTVPRRVPRALGDIPRPTWFDVNILRVSPRGDPARHFTIPINGITTYASVADFLTAVKAHMGEAGDFKDHAIVFVHGYRMTFEDALYRTAQITYDLGSDGVPFGTAYLYSWPSGGELKDYKYDFDSARFAVEHLRSFLDIVVSKSGAKKVHIIAHSMGNWPLLSALKSYRKPARGSADIHQLILAAPDIDAKEFVRMAAQIPATCKGVTLYASSNDIAMKAAREIHRGAVRAGDVTADGPAILMRGIDTIDVSVLSTAAISTGHSEYADRKELLNDVGLLLRKGERPPHLRTPIFERLHARNQEYWRYPK